MLRILFLVVSSDFSNPHSVASDDWMVANGVINLGCVGVSPSLN